MYINQACMFMMYINMYTHKKMYLWWKCSSSNMAFKFLCTFYTYKYFWNKFFLYANERALQKNILFVTFFLHLFAFVGTFIENLPRNMVRVVHLCWTCDRWIFLSGWFTNKTEDKTVRIYLLNLFLKQHEKVFGKIC